MYKSQTQLLSLCWEDLSRDRRRYKAAHKKKKKNQSHVSCGFGASISLKFLAEHWGEPYNFQLVSLLWDTNSSQGAARETCVHDQINQYSSAATFEDLSRLLFQFYCYFHMSRIDFPPSRALVVQRHKGWGAGGGAAAE